MSLAIITAAGSGGQIIGPPTAEWLLSFLPWQTIFVVFSVSILLAVVLALPLIKSPQVATTAELDESLGSILLKAFKDPTFALIFLGFFSCGYQLGFLTAHFPGWRRARQQQAVHRTRFLRCQIRPGPPGPSVERG